jgi:hypothetical protein
MFLDQDRVAAAISSKRRIGKLFRSQFEGLMDAYVVRAYIANDQIPDVVVDGTPAKCPASSFFAEHRYLMPIDVNPVLRTVTPQMVAEYNSAKGFQIEYALHFFDTFLVAEILPNSRQTEFLVIAPVNSGDEGVIGGMMATTAVFDLLRFAQDPYLRVALNAKMGQLLEFLRSGARRKLFGLF